MSKCVRWTWLVALPLLGCPQQGTEGTVEDPNEDLTVVVEADKSKILQEEEKLREDQSSLEKERDRLAQAREDVLSKISTLSKKDRKQRAKLEAEQTRLAREEDQLRNRMSKIDKERSDLEERKTELLRNIEKLTGQGKNPMAGRINQLERRQKDILDAQKKNTELLETILAAVKSSGTAKTVVYRETASSGGGGGGSSKGQVKRIEANIRAKMSAKGILVADLPPAARELRTSAQKSASSRDWSSAYDSFQQLEAIVSSIKVDHEFVQAKFRRINRSYEGKMKSLGDKKKNQVLVLLDDVSDSFSDGRYDRANRKINQIHSLLER